MASSSYRTFLMYKAESASTYTKLVDIKDYGDLGGAPEMLTTTTLSDNMETYTEGIQSSDALEFTINYDLATYTRLMGLREKEIEFAVWFGGTGDGANLVPTGSEGKFEFKGYLTPRIVGKGINEVREAIISIAPSTPISLGE